MHQMLRRERVQYGCSKHLNEFAQAISKIDSTAFTELVETLRILNNLKPLPEYLFGKLAVDDLGTALVPEQQFLLEPGETLFATR